MQRRYLRWGELLSRRQALVVSLAGSEGGADGVGDGRHVYSPMFGWYGMIIRGFSTVGSPLQQLFF